MPSVTLPVNDGLYIADSVVGLTTFAPLFMDGYIDAFGNSYRRPGVGSEVVNVGDSLSMTGSFKWCRRGVTMVIFVDSGGNISRVTKAGGLVLTDITGDKLSGLNRPTFAISSDGLFLLITDGGRIVFTDGTTNTSFIGDTNAPLKSTHIANLNSKIVASNVNSDTWQWSEVADYTDWSALSFTTSETKPDVIVSLIEHNREIITGGTESIETWFDNGVSPWIRNHGRYVSRGIGAAYTFIKLGNTLAYINREGKLDILVGSNPRSVSNPVDLLIQTFDRFDDAVADKIEISGRKFCVITFPSANVTLAYDYELDKWARWGYWNQNTYRWDAWLASCHVYVPEWNMHLVGDRRPSGKVFELKSDNTDDDGSEIRYMRQTFHSDYGTLEEKLNQYVRGLVKRGQAEVTAVNNPVLMIRHKDDNGSWSNEIWVDLGATGDLRINITDQDIQEYFTTRQWEIAYSEKTLFTHGRFTEELMEMAT